MFAVYADRPSPDDPLAALVVGERPEPEVPDGWVAVRVRAASLNMHDLWTLRGVGITAEQFPMILGCDGAGTLPDGAEVVVHSVISSPGWTGDETLDPRRTLLTEKHQGTLAETVVVPAANVLPKPASLSFAEAACLGTAWLTAYRMIFVRSGLRPGQTMLVQGASGGVSTALVQLGRAAGLRVWVMGRSERKRELAERLGAHATFESGARLPERVDGVFETVGKATWSHSIRALRPGGVLVCSGATSGGDPGAELQRLFFLQLRVVGSTMGTREELRDLIGFLDATGLRPQIGQELPMTEAPAGFRAMLDGETAGKIVFTR
ncbi:MAG TPA: zinc-binding dehydrogenase [Pseudonocardiaceae bacterium]